MTIYHPRTQTRQHTFPFPNSLRQRRADRSKLTRPGSSVGQEVNALVGGGNAAVDAGLRGLREHNVLDPVAVAAAVWVEAGVDGGSGLAGGDGRTRGGGRHGRGGEEGKDSGGLHVEGKLVRRFLLMSW